MHGEPAHERDESEERYLRRSTLRKSVHVVQSPACSSTRKTLCRASLRPWRGIPADSALADKPRKSASSAVAEFRIFAARHVP
jgi:hypothetical protein